MASTRIAARLAIGFTGALLLASGCGDGAASAGAGAAGEDAEPAALIDLEPGDCFSGLDVDLGAPASAATVVAMPCGEPHDHEVFHAFEFGPAEEYPGEADMMALAESGCRDAFVDSVGNADALDQISIWPTVASWAEGDRAVLCAAFARDGDRLVGSIR